MWKKKKNENNLSSLKMEMYLIWKELLDCIVWGAGPDADAFGAIYIKKTIKNIKIILKNIKIILKTIKIILKIIKNHIKNNKNHFKPNKTYQHWLDRDVRHCRSTDSTTPSRRDTPRPRPISPTSTDTPASLFWRRLIKLSV